MEKENNERPLVNTNENEHIISAIVDTNDDECQKAFQSNENIAIDQIEQMDEEMPTLQAKDIEAIRQRIDEKIIITSPKSTELSTIPQNKIDVEPPNEQILLETPYQICPNPQQARPFQRQGQKSKTYVVTKLSEPQLPPYFGQSFRRKPPGTPPQKIQPRDDVWERYKTFIKSEIQRQPNLGDKKIWSQVRRWSQDQQKRKIFPFLHRQPDSQRKTHLDARHGPIGPLHNYGLNRERAASLYHPGAELIVQDTANQGQEWSQKPVQSNCQSLVRMESSQCNDQTTHHSYASFTVNQEHLTRLQNRIYSPNVDPHNSIQQTTREVAPSLENAEKQRFNATGSESASSTMMMEEQMRYSNIDPLVAPFDHQIVSNASQQGQNIHYNQIIQEAIGKNQSQFHQNRNPFPPEHLSGVSQTHLGGNIELNQQQLQQVAMRPTMEENQMNQTLRTANLIEKSSAPQQAEVGRKAKGFQPSLVDRTGRSIKANTIIQDGQGLGIPQFAAVQKRRSYQELIARSRSQNQQATGIKMMFPDDKEPTFNKSAKIVPAIQIIPIEIGFLGSAQTSSIANIIIPITQASGTSESTMDGSQPDIGDIRLPKTSSLPTVDTEVQVTQKVGSVPEISYIPKESASVIDHTRRISTEASHQWFPTPMADRQLNADGKIVEKMIEYKEMVVTTIYTRESSNVVRKPIQNIIITRPEQQFQGESHSD